MSKIYLELVKDEVVKPEFYPAGFIDYIDTINYLIDNKELSFNSILPQILKLNNASKILVLWLNNINNIDKLSVIRVMSKHPRLLTDVYELNESYRIMICKELIINNKLDLFESIMPFLERDKGYKEIVSLYLSKFNFLLNKHINDFVYIDKENRRLMNIINSIDRNFKYDELYNDIYNYCFLINEGVNSFISLNTEELDKSDKELHLSKIAFMDGLILSDAFNIIKDKYRNKFLNKSMYYSYYDDYSIYYYLLISNNFDNTLFNKFLNTYDLEMLRIVDLNISSVRKEDINYKYNEMQELFNPDENMYRAIEYFKTDSPLQQKIYKN